MKIGKVAIAATLAAMILAAPAAFAQKAKKTVVGYAVMRMVDEYWGNQIAGMKKSIADNKYPIDLKVADNNNDGQTTLENVDSLIAQGAKILMVSTPDPKVGPAIMEKAKAAKIPVIASDVPIDGAYYLNHDDVEAGRIVGEYAGKYFKEHFPGKKAKVATLTHLAVEQIVGLRSDGFEKGFKKYLPDAVFLPRMDCQGLREKGADVAADILTANPDVSIFFAINDDMALGAASAIEQRGLQGKVAVFGQGGIGEASFRALLDPNSPFKATTAYSPSVHGQTAIDKFVMPLLNGKKVAQRIDSPLSLATPENAQSYLAK